MEIITVHPVLATKFLFFSTIASAKSFAATDTLALLM